tara:strand:- start:111 stop:329 length:219 start_codon:yes stop_codon:yes gene_type:complete
VVVEVVVVEDQVIMVQPLDQVEQVVVVEVADNQAHVQLLEQLILVVVAEVELTLVILLQQQEKVKQVDQVLL